MDKKTFIESLEKTKFEKEFLRRNLALSTIRKEILEFLIKRESEDEFYDFFKKSDFDKSFIQEICKEIEDAGWKWKFGFGDTALFIFQEDVPITCWG
jgi:hypothetical protein